MEPVNAEIRELLERGRAALRAGKTAEAEALFLKALSLGPRIGWTHHIMARIRMGQGRFDNAEAFARDAVAMAPDVPEFHETLAAALARTGRAAEVLKEYRETAARRPGDFAAACALFTLLAATGYREAALETAKAALRLAPESRFVKLQAVSLNIGTNRFTEAMAELESLLAQGDDGATVHGLAGRCLLELGDAPAAAESFEKALAKLPGNFEYHTGLSTAYWKSGKADEARQATQRCLRRWPHRSFASGTPEARVLVLSGLAEECFRKPLGAAEAYRIGNTVGQVPVGRLAFHNVFITHPDPLAAARAAGPVDIVFNNIATAEAAISRGDTPRIRRVLDTLGVPVINAPEAVARTSRGENAERIPAALDIVVPRTGRYGLTRETLAGTVAEIAAGFIFPVIVRRLDTQRDTGVRRVDDEGALSDMLEGYIDHGIGEFYAIEYRGGMFRPGLHRRLRGALIDGVFHPSLGDFSGHWNVHRLDAVNAFMKANPALMEEERAFLSDPAAHIGAKHVAELEALAGLAGLEFLGLDFNVTNEDELVVFEANPAMRMCFPHLYDDFPYLAEPHEKLASALEEMILEKARG